jgi:hypothetical protein
MILLSFVSFFLEDRPRETFSQEENRRDMAVSGCDSAVVGADAENFLMRKTGHRRLIRQV